jgi:hypothetical protein
VLSRQADDQLAAHVARFADPVSFGREELDELMAGS